MLTRITEEDWAIVLVLLVARGGVTRAATTVSFSKRFTRRALPAEFGFWNSDWKRFWRLSQSGVFMAFFEALASFGETAHLVQMFDSTVIRAHVSAAGAKGARRRSPWTFTGRLLDETPPQDRSRWLSSNLTGGEASDRPQL
jgi:hypothetical protein